MKTVDISGMDPARGQYGYEWGCQVLMFRALEWLRKRPVNSPTPKFTGYENYVGVMTPENQAAEAMEKYALDHPKIKEYGATGAMVQYSLIHAMKRFQLGEESYFDHFKDTPKRVFEFDEAEAFEVETK
jgi:hypothetical protein